PPLIQSSLTSSQCCHRRKSSWSRIHLEAPRKRPPFVASIRRLSTRGSDRRRSSRHFRFWSSCCLSSSFFVISLVALRFSSMMYMSMSRITAASAFLTDCHASDHLSHLPISRTTTAARRLEGKLTLFL